MIRRVLIFTREFPPAIGPHSIRMAKLAKYLPRFGWEPIVITTPVDHAWATDHTLEDDVAGLVVRIPRLLSSIVGPRHGLSPASAGPLPTPDDWQHTGKGRLARWLLPDSSVLWAIAAARRMPRLPARPDVVYASGPPFSTFLASHRVAARLGIPWVAEYRDNWTTNPLYRRGNVAQAINEALEKKFLRSASLVVVISDAARDELARSFPFIENRIVVASNGYDPDDLPPPLPRPRCFEIVYAGSLHRRRDPSTLLRALAEMCEEDPRFAAHVRIRFVGNVPRWVAQAADAALGSARVAMEGIQPHRIALRWCAGAAVLLAISSEAEAGSTAMTSKLMEYLGLRRPILLLAPPGPGTRLVSELGAGLSANPTDLPGIKRALCALFEAWWTNSVLVPPSEALLPFTRIEMASRIATALSLALTGDSIPSLLRSQPRPALHRAGN